MAVKKTVLAYSTDTQTEFEASVMASAIKATRGLGDIVKAFYQHIGFNAEGFCAKGMELAGVALTHEYQIIFVLAQKVSKELNLQFSDMSRGYKAVEVSRLKAIKALTFEPKPKPKRATYINALDTSELAVKPVRLMLNIYCGVYNSGNSFEYKRDKEYLETLIITNPRKVKVGIVPIKMAVTTAKAQKTDIWKERQITFITEYNHKVEELFCA